MTLTLTTLITAIALIAIGGLFLWSPKAWQSAVEKFPRSELASYLTMGIGGLWFLYEVSRLGRADELFGPATRPVFLLVFGITWVGSFFVVKDFLAIRGACILVLMLATEALASAYQLYEIPQRLFLVTLVYVLISLAIYLGVSPFRVRDFLEWAYAKRTRIRLFGGLLLAYGVLLAGVATTYP